MNNLLPYAFARDFGVLARSDGGGETPVLGAHDANARVSQSERRVIGGAVIDDQNAASSDSFSTERINGALHRLRTAVMHHHRLCAHGGCVHRRRRQ